MEAKLLGFGVTPQAAHIFSSEMQDAATREALIQVVADTMTSEFTPGEIRQIRSFIESPAGAKFQQFIYRPAALAGYFSPIVRQACDKTLPQVSGTDRLVFSVGCRQLQK